MAILRQSSSLCVGSRRGEEHTLRPGGAGAGRDCRKQSTAPETDTWTLAGRALPWNSFLFFCFKDIKVYFSQKIVLELGNRVVP